MTIPEPKKETLDRIIEDLKRIDHVVAIVLGGSYCMGMATENSDLDVGIYYHQATPFAIEKIRELVKKHTVDDSFTVTDFYQWGAWVNGGAWINTASGEVDFLYRNIEQVESVIQKSKDGVWENDFEQQPPYGFSSVIYLAETHYCAPLYDPHHIVRDLKRELTQYPPKLKRTIVQQALWAAEFTLWQADKFARKGDPYNAIGCFTRALKKMVDALFALNEAYPLGDKRAISLLEQMPICPDGLSRQIDDILCIDKGELVTSAEKLRNLIDQVVRLSGGMYHPYFIL